MKKSNVKLIGLNDIEHDLISSLAERLWKAHPDKAALINTFLDSQKVNGLALMGHLAFAIRGRYAEENEGWPDKIQHLEPKLAHDGYIKLGDVPEMENDPTYDRTEPDREAPPTHLIVPFRVVAAITTISGILGRGFTMCGLEHMVWGPFSNEDHVHLIWDDEEPGEPVVRIDMALYEEDRKAFYAIVGFAGSVGFEVVEVTDLISYRDY